MIFVRRLFRVILGREAPYPSPDIGRYNRYDRHIEDLRRAKMEVKEMRRVITRPTGNFVEDMSTGRYAKEAESEGD